MSLTIGFNEKKNANAEGGRKSVPARTNVYVFTWANPQRYTDPDGQDPKPAIEGKHPFDIVYKAKEGAVVNKQITNLEGEEQGRIKVLSGEAKVGIGKEGIVGKVGVEAFKVEAHGNHVAVEQTAVAAGVQFGLTRKGLETEVEATLIEGKVGGYGNLAGFDVKGSFVVGVTAGAELKIGKGRFKAQVKVFIGFEFEFEYAEEKSEAAPPIHISSEEDTSTRSSYSAKEELPPLPPPRLPQRPIRPTLKPNVHGCQFGPDSPDPRSKAYVGASPLR